nr:MAG TPA: hypothetical protein [Caudoviricetes sp.]
MISLSKILLMALLYQKSKPQTKKPPDWVASLGRLL